MKSFARPLDAALPLARLALVIALFFIDLQDLVGKLFWLGPSDAFAFHASNTDVFDSNPLKWAVEANTTQWKRPESGESIQRASGWTSLYDKCDKLYPIESSTKGFFHTVRATNCQLGSPSKPHRAQEIVFTASLRVDSVAWASCRLLQFNRRPQVCQENLVTQFASRYRLEEAQVARNQVAAVHSNAEKELLNMLELISYSYPLSGIVCGQGFQSSSGVGIFAPNLVMCGSPNMFKSAVVGFHTPEFGAVHEDLSWLTVDRINILGLELVTRQNVRTIYTQQVSGDENVDDEDSTVMMIVENSVANFSSFGHIYVLIVAADVLLFWLHVRAALDTHHAFGMWCLLGDPSSQRRNDQPFGCWMMVYRSLIRSSPVMMLTALSTVLSWLLILPHSVIWKWSDATLGKPYALLTTMRVWMLVLCCVNVLWGFFANFVESRAYAFAKRTFVSLTEIMAITLVVISVERERVFSLSATKYALDGQRTEDSTSFTSSTALSNSYNEDLDGFGTTPPAILIAIFSPLIRVIGEAALLVMICATVKCFFNVSRHSGGSTSGSVNPVLIATPDDDDSQMLLSGNSDVSDIDSVSDAKLYCRLLLEDLAGEPIRASALVRSRLDLELRANGETYLLPEVYFESGLVIINQSVRTRQGFARMIRRRLDVRKFFPLTSSSGSSVMSAGIPSERLSTVSARVSALLMATDATTSASSTPSAATATQSSATAASGATSPPPSPPRKALHSPLELRAMRRRKSTTELQSLL